MDQKATEAETTKHFNSIHGEEETQTQGGGAKGGSMEQPLPQTYNEL